MVLDYGPNGNLMFKVRSIVKQVNGPSKALSSESRVSKT